MINIDILFTILLSLVMVYGAVLHYRYWRRDNAGSPRILNQRKIIALTLSVGGVVLWFICSAVYLYYDRTRSDIPDAQLGRLYSLMNHGHVVYVTLMERNSLILLAVAAGLLFLSGYIVDRNVRNSIARVVEENQRA
jgi:hypothetical protein